MENPSLYSIAKKAILRGISKEDSGLLHGFENIEEFYPAISKGTTNLIAGSTGSGKTSFVDELYVYRPLEYALANKKNVKWIYFSFEITKVRKLAKLVCRLFYLKYGIHIDMKTVLSQGKFKFPVEHLDKLETFQPYIDALDERIIIIDTPVNPTGMNKFMDSYVSKTFEKISHSEFQIEYKPIVDEHVIVIVDHIALIRSEQGFNKKQTIDKFCEYALRKNLNFK